MQKVIKYCRNSIACIVVLTLISSQVLAESLQRVESLQIRSIFEKIIDVTGWKDDYENRMRIETALILKMISTGPERAILFSDINAALDRMYSGTDKERIWDVMPSSRKDEEKIVLDVKVANGKNKGKMFRILSRCGEIGGISATSSEELARPGDYSIPLGSKFSEELNNTAVYKLYLDSLKYFGYKISKEQLAGDLGEITQAALPYPNGINIAIDIGGVKGLELAGVVQSKLGINGVNFIYVLPGDNLFFGRENPDMVFAEYGVFVNKKGKIGYGHFKNPIPIHGIADAGLAAGSRLHFEDRGIPLLSPERIVELTRDKVRFHEFKKECGLDTYPYTVLENKGKDALKQEIESFLERENIGSFVIKPVDGMTGTGVKLFEAGEIDAGVEHAASLFGEGRQEVLLEKRIESKLWKEGDTHFDWNIRVLATWDGDEVVVTPKMVQIRYKKYGSGPVNRMKGAAVLSLKEFMNMRGMRGRERDFFFEQIRKKAEESMNALYRKYGEKPGLIGWDFIMDDNGKLFTNEANAGAIGGLDTLEMKLEAEERGDVIAPLVAYLKQMAEKYKKEKEHVITDSVNTRVPAKNSLATMGLFIKALFYSREYEAVEHFVRLTLELYGGEVSSHFFYRYGVAFQNQGKYEDAERAYRYSLIIDDKNAQSWEKLIVVLINMARYFEAIETVKIALRYVKDNERIHSLLGYAYLKVNSLDSGGAFNQILKAQSDERIRTMGIAEPPALNGAPETKVSAGAVQSKTWLNYLAFLKREIVRKISNIHKRNQHVSKAVSASLEDKSGGPGIDIVIDLSLIPKSDLKDNIATLAYLILRYSDMENVNFIFEKKLNILKGKTLSKKLEDQIASAPEVGDAIGAIKRVITEKSYLAGIDTAKLKKLCERIRSRDDVVQRKDGQSPIEISVTSAPLLEWMRDNNIKLADNQYPVALSGYSSDGIFGLQVRDFESALTVGMAKAALVSAQRRAAEDFDSFRRELLLRLNELYQEARPGEDIVLTEETLHNLIDSDPVQRLNRALELYLPPIVPRMAEKEIEYFQSEIHTFLMSA